MNYHARKMSDKFYLCQNFFNMNFIEELNWRGMIHTVMPGTEEQLAKEMTTGYIGYDPTSDSLHIGNLVTIMLLKHFQLAGHRPCVIVGGATGMIGDPSGKSQERNLLDEDALRHNQECIKKQLMKFLDFDSPAPNAALILNNYDWMKTFSFLDFLRQVGKHLTINYMMAKDSVQNRLATGLSFTEFSYQLLQAYDFFHLFKTIDCKFQMGGSDQWGNITSGSELIRRMAGGEAFALTCPLITKADGGKFGKSEEGNVWLDPQKTSPYNFYQFWLNTTDEDANNFIRIFSLLSRQEIENLIEEHGKAPHLRVLQKALARDITIRVHSQEDYESAVKASEILFGGGTTETLKSLDEKTFLSIFDGVPVSEVPVSLFENPLKIVDFLSDHTNVFPSKSEARRMLKSNAVLVNKNKIDDTFEVTKSDLLNDRHILIQKGKKNYHIVRCV